MRYHHSIYPDEITFDRDIVLKRVKELGYDPADYVEEANLLHEREGRYNSWMDFVHDIYAYDFIDDDGKDHLVPAIVLMQPKEDSSNA